MIEDESIDDAGPLAPNVLLALKEFSSALRHQTEYPEGHPVLVPVARRLRRVLETPLSESKLLTITVHRDRLEVGGAATDAMDHTLSGLAGRLHSHQVKSLTFRRGIQPDELSELLEALSQDVDLGAEALGLAPDEGLSWSHIELGGLGDDEEEGSEGLWMGLDAAPFGTELAGRDLVVTEARKVARSIEGALGDESSDRSVAVQMFRLATDLTGASGQGATILFRRMSELVLLLEPRTLKYLLKLGEGDRTNRFLQDCSQWMEAKALIELVKTAAENRRDGTASVLIQLTTKLARQTFLGRRPHSSEADSAIRAIVQGMIEEWNRESVRPDAYGDELARNSTSQSDTRGTTEHKESVVEPERMIEMCIELDQPNEKAREASAQLMAAGEAAKLLDLLEQAPQDSSVASQLWSEISNPRALRRLLAARRPDFDALDRIFAHLGPAGAESMLDALSRSKARPVRQYLLEQITEMGSEVGPQIADMVADPRWYVVRNMLVLLSSLTFWPEDFDISPYLAHSEPRVRVAAFRLAAWRQDHRERAICLALQDADERVVAVGLAAAGESCPLAAEPILARQLRRREWPTEHRVQALRALGTLESRSALTSIAGACLRPRWIFGRQLSSEAALVQAGVSVLTKRWPESREAQRVLRLTAKQGTRASAGRRQTDTQPSTSAGRQRTDAQPRTSAGRRQTDRQNG